MSAVGDVLVAPNPRSRSRITNGSARLPGVDGRGTWTRRLRDLIALHTADLGGDDAISEGERSIIRRAAVHETELERLEQKFALAGEADGDDLDLYIRGSGNLRRLLEAVGLERRARDLVPDLKQYLSTHSQKAKEAA